MENKEILKKALDKAQRNGFKLLNDKHIFVVKNDALGRPTKQFMGHESLIFDHDFAKAFWGEEYHYLPSDRNGLGVVPCYDCHSETHKEGECWEANLQQMVLEEDPIKYLEKFL